MPTGWPTTFTLWTMCCARFVRTFRGATTSSCQSWESPPLSGYPRVYALAVTLIAHTDSELDEPKISRFVQAFQEVVPLTIGELWALPTMFRLVLLENLRRLAEQMLRALGANGSGPSAGSNRPWRFAESAGIDRSGNRSRGSACTLERPQRSVRRSPGAIAARSGTGGRPRAAPARSRAGRELAGI